MSLTTDPIKLADQARRKEVGGLFGWGKDMEAAASLYTKASYSCLQLEKDTDAVHYIYRAAACYCKSDNVLDALACYKRVSNLNISVKEKKEALHKIDELASVHGRYQDAAKAMEVLSILNEDEFNWEAALQNIWKARQYFSYTPHSDFSIKRCVERLGKCYVNLEKYPQAFACYKELAEEALKCEIRRYTLPEYVLKGTICCLCYDDAVAATRFLGWAADEHPSIERSREFILCKSLLESVNEKRLNTFTNAVANYDSVSPIEKMWVLPLLKIKDALNCESEETNQLV